MARKKVTDGPRPDDTPAAVAIAEEAPATQEPASKSAEPPIPQAPPPVPGPTVASGNGNRGTIVRTFSYPVSLDTWVQALVSERVVTLKDQSTFLSHEVTTRKLWRTQTGEDKALYTYRCSELYALLHAIKKAEEWILDQRASNDCPF